MILPLSIALTGLLVLFAADPANADFLNDAFASFTNFHTGAYALGVAFLVGATIALAKQGWFSAWVAARIPSKLIPAIAVVMSGAVTWSTEVIGGGNWRSALLDAFRIAGIAVLGHQAVIEGMRGGKEIVPVAPYAKPGPSKVSIPPSVMGAFALLGLLAGLAAPVALSGCAPGTTPKTVLEDVLTGDQVACAVLSAALPVPQVMAVCKIDETLAATVQNLLDGIAKARMQNPGAAPAPLPLHSENAFPPPAYDPRPRQRTASLWTGVAVAH